jgi:FkbM family methyltransferase
MPFTPDPDNAFPYELAASGEEGLIRAFLAQRPEADPFVFFDVGANRGDWTKCVLSRAPQPVEGHLFEISSVMQRRLYERFLVLDPDQHLHFNNFGLGDKTAHLPFKRYAGYEGLNTIVDTEYWDLTYVPTVEYCQTMTGDMYCSANQIEYINFLKIDTEGWDWKVLQGFSSMLAHNRIEVVQFEYGYTTADLHVVLKDFYDYLKNYGYTLGRLNRLGVDWTPFQYADNDFHRCPNWVAFAPSAMKDI